MVSKIFLKNFHIDSLKCSGIFLIFDNDKNRSYYLKIINLKKCKKSSKTQNLTEYIHHSDSTFRESSCTVFFYQELIPK